jgi:secreted trypsin-like serine protease
MAPLAIIGGTDSGPSHDAVVVLATFRQGVRTNLCTATLVAPNLILTARHCVSDADSTTACSKEGSPIVGSMIKASRAPGSLAVFVGTGGITPDSTREQGAKARGKSLVVEPSLSLCNGDLAFVVLDRALDAPVVALRLSPPSTAERLDVVGWGIDETGSLPTRRQVRADVPLIGVGPAMYPNNSTWGYGDREFMLGESACAGDSGSPAFAKSGALVGVAARAGNGKPRDPRNAASTCMGESSHAVYTHISAFRTLLDQAFAAAGAAPKLEAQPSSTALASEPTAEAPSEPPAMTKRARSVEDAPVEASDNSEQVEASSCSVHATPLRHGPRFPFAVVSLLGALGLGARRTRRTRRATELRTPKDR